MRTSMAMLKGCWVATPLSCWHAGMAFCEVIIVPDGSRMLGSSEGLYTYIGLRFHLSGNHSAATLTGLEVSRHAASKFQTTMALVL